MKNKSTPLVDDHVQSLANMREAETDPFFYSRLKSRMENKTARKFPALPVRPAWVIGTLALLLVINGFMLVNQFSASNTKTKSSSSLQSFAESFDQTISSY